MDEPFRILSLDGGGTWALMEVRALARLFGPDTPGHEVLRPFRLVVANSGGSIVAAGLAANMRLSELLGYFEDEAWRRRVFVQRPLLSPPLWEVLFRFIPKARDIVPRYLAPAKLLGLQGAFPSEFVSLRMDAWRRDARRAGLPDFVFTAFDYDRRRARFFRTRTDSPAASHSAMPNVTFLEAVHASTNAPVMFFDAPADVGGRRYWDGAMAAYNNPVMVGVVEALSHIGTPPRREDLRVLSLGTGIIGSFGVPPETGGPVADERLRLDTTSPPDPLGDARKLAECIIDDPPDAASFMAHVTLGHRLPAAGERVGDGPVVRMNPWLSAVWRGGRWDYPEGIPPELFHRLRTLDLDAIAQDDVRAIETLCTAWLEGRVPNQPLRANDRMACEVGHPSFPEALAQLRTWLPVRS